MKVTVLRNQNVPEPQVMIYIYLKYIRAKAFLKKETTDVSAIYKVPFSI